MRTLVLAVIAIAAALLIVVAVGLGGQFAPGTGAVAQEQKVTIESISHDEFEDEPEGFIAEGGRSAIVLSSEITEVEVKRGMQVEVPIMVKHLGSTDAYPQLGVTLISTALFYPPTVAKSTTVEERLEILESGGTPNGSIPMSALFHMTPETISLRAGETQMTSLVVNIPLTFPDEMVGKSVYISPELAVTGKDPNSTDVGVFTFGVKATITG